MSDLIITIVLGIIEGITEFLPVSSTGHLIVATELLNPSWNPVTRASLEIFIQFGAVLAMIVFYRAELWTQARTITRDRGVQRFWFAIAIAFIPAAIIGVLARGFIKELLFNPTVVAVMLVIGGVLLIVVERVPALKRRERTSDTTQISVGQALVIGVAQAFALIPGMSRSAMSIVGGMIAGLDRQAATRFSFYLAISHAWPRHTRRFHLQPRRDQSGRPAVLSDWGRRGLLRGAGVHTLVAALRRRPQLRAVRPLPHRDGYSYRHSVRDTRAMKD